MGVNTHYTKNTYTRNLTLEEIRSGKVTILIDPYRVARMLGAAMGGAREQIMKKAMRWTDKGATEEKVCDEIICAATRHKGMLAEDATPHTCYSDLPRHDAAPPAAPVRALLTREEAKQRLEDIRLLRNHVHSSHNARHGAMDELRFLFGIPEGE